jgi:arsenate reductase (thioredoxin)
VTTPTYNVLFLCTGNSARSILAEAVMNHITSHGGRFKAYSAGSFPKSQPNPYALDLLRNNHIATDELHSKSWDEFATPDAPKLDFVFTVCDQAAGEMCPIWPGQPVTAHWGVPDPAAVEGTDEEKRRAFLDAYVTLRRRIDLFTSLPIATLDKMALEQRVRAIGLQ